MLQKSQFLKVFGFINSMVMKVGKINSVLFRAQSNITKPEEDNRKRPVIKELVNITPDFGVVAPQKYTKINEVETKNGLKIHSYKLANGHKVTIIPMEDSPAIVKNYVNVGSMNETDDIKGISHFLEHMAFNGTLGTEGYLQLKRGDSFKKIEEMGGWTNASTNYALTDYVNSTPLLNNKDLEKQIRVIASMTEDLALTPDMIEKEKSPVSSEIDMILDKPETVAIDQTIRTLFNVKSSADELVGGSVKHIQNLDRQKVLDYYNKYYTPDNMHLVITGNVNPEEVMGIVSKNFHSNKKSTSARYDEKLTPINKATRKDFINDKATSSLVLLGFAGPKSNDTKSKVISEIVASYINSTKSGFNKEFKQLNAEADFGTEKISTNPNNPTFIYLGADCADENSEKVLKMLFDKLSALKSPDGKDLDNIKKSLIMAYNNTMEYSSAINDLAGTAYFNNDWEYLTNYEDIVKSITPDDIDEFIKNYFDVSKAAVTVMHPEVKETEIWNNYNKAQNLCFRGNKRLPVNTNNINQQTLNNNYNTAFVESKNNNTPFKISLYYDLPQNINPAAITVLDDILSRGTLNQTEEEFRQVEEENNISVYASLNKKKLSIGANSSQEDFSKGFNQAKELIENPRITEKEVKDSVERLRDKLVRTPDSASGLYSSHESKNNPYYTSKEDVLKGLGTLTAEDVKNLHEYIINNAKGTITVNVPKAHKEFQNIAKSLFEELPSVKPYEYKPIKVYKENNTPVVLTKARNVSQADIKQIYKFQIEDSIKEKTTAKLMNSILSTSNSIGLFNSLRERDHLAYRVNSNIKRIGDSAEISLNILTSTDNKDIGEYTYDNLQKSIKGFNRQIGKLLASEYTDQDLETAKRNLKASLLNKESVSSKIASVDKSISYGNGVDYDNKVFEIIDSITREDIDNMARRAFAHPATYAIIASEDTLNYNKDFLNSLKG